MKTEVIAHKYLPAQLPVVSSWLGWLTFRVVDVPGWVRGSFWTLMALLWIVALHRVLHTEQRHPCRIKEE